MITVLRLANIESQMINNINQLIDFQTIFFYLVYYETVVIKKQM